MSTMCSGGRIAVIKSRSGIEVTTFRDELECVIGMIDNGALGGGSSYGCEEHVVALAAVSNKIEDIRRQIEADALDEFASDDEP